MEADLFWPRRHVAMQLFRVHLFFKDHSHLTLAYNDGVIRLSPQLLLSCQT